MPAQDTSKTRATLLVLLALRGGPKHGYEIAGWIADRSAGFFQLSFGALYPVLHKLEKDQLLSARWEAVGAAGVKKKKIYTLTPRGRRALESERQRFEALAGAFARLMEES